ncbi:hypothetical protein [Bradyrhizobium liaoningense]|uniref:hypothetical protein n=1 Tax=Bradyrhizobium liaoningense TaxID=43992 RepID=UPI001BAC788C|nr:hypothetical protein [Bradyrhizobium liaoningense]MBR0816352.1 hypothetical protein [Bradyrhizobium liaoningense]
MADISCLSQTIASGGDGVMTSSAPMHRLHAGQPQREWQEVVHLTEILHIVVNDGG